MGTDAGLRKFRKPDGSKMDDCDFKCSKCNIFTVEYGVNLTMRTQAKRIRTFTLHERKCNGKHLPKPKKGDKSRGRNMIQGQQMAVCTDFKATACSSIIYELPSTLFQHH